MVLALFVLIASGCAANEETTSLTTTNAVVSEGTSVVERSQPAPSGVEQPEGDSAELEPEQVGSVTAEKPERVDTATSTASTLTGTTEPTPTTTTPPSTATTGAITNSQSATTTSASTLPTTATTTTTPKSSTVVEAAEVATPPPSQVGQAGDSDSSSPENLQVAERPESAVTVLLSLLEALAVQPERRSGYDRGLFDHWVDADGDRCDARREVLIAEAVVFPRVGASCSLSGGQWYSVYDGATEQGTGRGFDVDHLVPLAEAWDSGAYAWDSATRRRYANDLGYAHSLVAVSASSNRQKGAGDPADWLPPLASARCWYAEAWIAVKTRWELSVDSAELAALRSLVSQCEDWELGAAPVQASAVLAATGSGPTTTTTLAAADDLCHPAYIPCLPNLAGDALNCGDLSSSQRPVQVREIGVDPYRLDRDRDGFGCTS